MFTIFQKASHTHFDFINMGSDMLSFRVIAIQNQKFRFGSPCINKHSHWLKNGKSKTNNGQYFTSDFTTYTTHTSLTPSLVDFHIASISLPESLSSLWVAFLGADKMKVLQGVPCLWVPYPFLLCL